MNSYYTYLLYTYVTNYIYLKIIVKCKNRGSGPNLTVIISPYYLDFINDAANTFDCNQFL